MIEPDDDEGQTGPPQVPPRIGELLGRVVRSLGGPAAPSIDLVEQVFGHWSEIVGELAGHTRPVSVRGGVLVVAVDEPGWATELRFRQGELIDRLDQRVGPGRVTRVEVRIQPRGMTRESPVSLVDSQHRDSRFRPAVLRRSDATGSPP